MGPSNWYNNIVFRDENAESKTLVLAVYSK